MATPAAPPAGPSSGKEFASLEEMGALLFDDLIEFIDRQGKRRFADPTDNARRLQQVVEDSYPLPPTLQPPLNLSLQLSFQHISLLERQVKRLDTAIAERMAALPHTLETIPGFGPVFAGGIFSELGDLRRFGDDHAMVAKFAGFKWRRHQSAAFAAEDTPLTRTGNRYLRYYFCEAANAVRMRDAEYAASYERKYHEVRKHQHKRALVLTARKLIRLVVRADDQPAVSAKEADVSCEPCQPVTRWSPRRSSLGTSGWNCGPSRRVGSVRLQNGPQGLSEGLDKSPHRF